MKLHIIYNIYDIYIMRRFISGVHTLILQLRNNPLTSNCGRLELIVFNVFIFLCPTKIFLV